MADHSADNKRIIKNTLLLYVRTFATMAVGLYTSRLTLQLLGVDNYGIYNVVGGFVSLFSLINGSLTSASSRFITFTLGTNNLEESKRVFSSVFNIHAILALIILILAETIGIWFLQNQMEIPNGREDAAMVVFQCSLITFLLGLMLVPYNASIVAHEKMGAFAWLSIFDVISKLVLVSCLYFVSSDRLIFYAIFNLISSLLVQLLHWIYCKRKFEECVWNPKNQSNQFKKMLSFAGWNFIGSSSALLSGHGVNLLYNIFFGVVANASMGVANQVLGWVTRFVYGFTSAINPQITKSYASGDLNYMHQLICKGSKFSYFLMFTFAFPLLVEADTLLSVWLAEVPTYAPLFTQLVIINALFGILSNTFITAQLATGDIKKYQIVVGGVQMLIVPLSYLAFKLGTDIYAALTITIIITIINTLLRSAFLRKSIQFQISYLMQNIVSPVAKVSVLGAIIPVLLHLTIQNNWLRLSSVIVLGVISSLISIYCVGLAYEERRFVIGKIKSIIPFLCK